MSNNIRLICSKDLMPLNEGAPVLEDLLTLPSINNNFEELWGHVEGISVSCSKKQNISLNTYKDCLALVLSSVQDYAQNLPEITQRIAEFESELKSQRKKINHIISDLQIIEKEMWSLFEYNTSGFDLDLKLLSCEEKTFLQMHCIVLPEEYLERTKFHGEVIEKAKASMNIHGKVIEKKGALKNDCFEPPLSLSIAPERCAIKSSNLSKFIGLRIKFKSTAAVLDEKINSYESRFLKFQKEYEQANQQLKQCTHDLIIKLRLIFPSDEDVYQLGSSTLEAIKII